MILFKHRSIILKTVVCLAIILAAGLLLLTRARAAIFITAVKSAGLAVDLDGDGEADPGDTVAYSVVIQNSGDMTATNVQFSDVIDANTTLVALAGRDFRTTPLARADAYQAIGNVGLAVPNGAGDLLANDSDPDGTGAVTLVVFDPTSANGGRVTAAADGRFTYTPPPGFTGTDTFTYTAADIDGNRDSATVTITVSGMIWFIDNSRGAAGDGRLTAPFNSLAAFEAVNGAGGSNPAAGDAIFIYETGAGNYDGGLTLENDQLVIGQGAAASLAAITGLTPPPFSRPLPATGGARPILTNSAGHGLTLARNNLIRGLNIGDTAGGAGLAGQPVGDLVISETAIIGAGKAVDINDGGALDVRLDQVQVTGSTAGGFSLQNVGGTVTLDALDITTTGGAALFAVAAGRLNINSSGSNTAAVNSSNGPGIRIENTTLEAIFTGVDVTHNSGFGVRFRNNGGSLAVTGAGNRIATTGGPALEIFETTIGASNVTFRSISAQNSSAGLILDTTGSQGGLTVTGDGSTAGSGGTIQNITQNGVQLANAQNVALRFMTLTNANTTDGSGQCNSSTNAGCRAAVNLTAVTNVALDHVTIDGAAQMGLNGRTVTNLDISNSLIQNAGNEINEHGLHIRNLLGLASAGEANSFDNLTVTGSENHNVFISNDTRTSATNPDLLVVVDSDFRNLTGPNGANGFLHEAAALATMRLEISNSAFIDNRGIGLNVQARQGGQNDLRLTGSTFEAGQTGGFDQDQAMVMAATQNSRIVFDIFDNALFRTSTGTAIGATGFDTASFEGRIRNNSRIQPGGAGHGIDVTLEGGATAIAGIDNNTITSSQFGRGMNLQTRAGSGSLDVIVSNNTINVPGGTFSGDGVFTASGNGDTGESNRLCIRYDSNDSAGGSGRDGYGLEQWAGTTFQIEGLTPATGASESQVETFVANQNSAGTADVEPAGFGLVVDYRAGTCAAPTVQAIPGRETMLARRGAARRPPSSLLTLAPPVEPTAGDRFAATGRPVPFDQAGEPVVAKTGFDRSPLSTGDAAQRVAAGSHPLLEDPFVRPILAALPRRHRLPAGGRLDQSWDAKGGQVEQKPASLSPARAGLASPLRNGETVEVDLGPMEAGQVVTITFRVAIDEALTPATTTQVCNQGAVSGDNFGNVMTDDPTTPTANDPTCTTLASGAIEIVKAAPPGDDNFDFTTTIPGGPAVFTLAADQSQIFKDVPPGQYRVTEADPTGQGYVLAGLVCDDAAGPGPSLGDVANRQATINLEAGERVTCTFSNALPGAITIIKNTPSGAPDDFAFTSTIQSLATFTLDDANPDDGDGVANTITVDPVTPGSYTLTEADPTPAGFVVSDIVCAEDRDQNSGVDVTARTAAVMLDSGENVVCTFTNVKDPGTVVIAKKSRPADAQPFTFTTSLPVGRFTLADSPPAGPDGLTNVLTFTIAPNATYTVTETDPTAYGFELTGLACAEDGVANSGQDVAARTATLVVEPDEFITCVFTNTSRQGAVIYLPVILK